MLLRLVRTKSCSAEGKDRLYSSSFIFSYRLGDAESEGVRGAVPETGNQLPERRTPSGPKSTFVFPSRTALETVMKALYLNCQTMCFQDKKYATDKYKDIYTELSIVKAKAERDLGRLRDQLQLAHEALGEPSLEEMERGGYGMN